MTTQRDSSAEPSGASIEKITLEIGEQIQGCFSRSMPIFPELPEPRVRDPYSAIPPAMVYLDSSPTDLLTYTGLQLRIQGMQGVAGVNRLGLQPAILVEIVVRVQPKDANFYAISQRCHLLSSNERKMSEIQVVKITDQDWSNIWLASSDAWQDYAPGINGAPYSEWWTLQAWEGGEHRRAQQQCPCMGPYLAQFGGEYMAAAEQCPAFVEACLAILRLAFDVSETREILSLPV